MCSGAREVFFCAAEELAREGYGGDGHCGGGVKCAGGDSASIGGISLLV